MKQSSRSMFFRPHFLLAAAALGSLAQAATFTWSNTTGGSWGDQANWSAGTLPTTAADTADLSTLDIAAATTVSLNGNQEINKLLFADATTASHDWTLAAGTPSTSTLTLGGTTPEISVTNRTAIISAKLAGSDGWTKKGAGSLRLQNSSNSFSGGLTVQTGIVQALRSVSTIPLGAVNNTVTINSNGNLTTGGQLLINANGAATNPVTQSFVIQGAGESGSNTNAAIILQAGGGSNVLNISGSITLDGTGTYRIRTFGNGANSKDGVNSIDGGITRSGANTGTLILEAYDFYAYANAFKSTTIVNSAIQNNGGPVTVVGSDNSILLLQASGNNIGAFTINYNNKDKNVVKLGIDDALKTNQNLTITRGTFDLAGFDQTVNELSGAATNSLITNTDAAPSTLTIGNGGGGATFSGLVAAGGAGAISLVKVGAGTATLSSTSTDITNTGFTGGFTVSEGKLYLNANRQLNPVTATIASGATLQLNLNNATDSMTFNGEGTLQTDTAIFGAPRVATYALGAGALIDVTGPLWVNPSSVWTTNLSDMNVASGANLYTAYGNVRVDSLTGSGTVNLSPGTADGDFGLTVGVNNGSGQFDGDFIDYSGAGSLRKVGNGTQTLSGAVGYSGNTNVSGGTLVLKQINTANELSTVTIAAGAVLGLDFVGTDTVDKLFFGATQQPLGTYSASSVPAGATITTASFSGTGTLTVTTGAVPISGFATWITGTFAGGATVPGGQQGPNNDPDGDGISNLVEYAIAGQDPTVPSGAVGTLTGKTLSFSKRQPLASDITYAIEESTDLGIADVWEVVTPTVNDGTTISHTLSDGPPKDFARLKITQP